MADAYLERVAGELATLALADEERSGDINIVDQIGEILGSSSQTLQEAFLTAVRVRRAEARARALLSERAGDAPKVKPAPIVDETPALPEDSTPEPAVQPEGEEATADEPLPQEEVSEEDAAFADVLSTLDEFLQAEDEAPKPPIAPTRPQRR